MEAGALNFVMLGYIYVCARGGLGFERIANSAAPGAPQECRDGSDDFESAQALSRVLT